MTRSKYLYHAQEQSDGSGRKTTFPRRYGRRAIRDAAETRDHCAESAHAHRCRRPLQRLVHHSHTSVPQPQRQAHFCTFKVNRLAVQEREGAGGWGPPRRGGRRRWRWRRRGPRLPAGDKRPPRGAPLPPPQLGPAPGPASPLVHHAALTPPCRLALFKQIGSPLSLLLP